MKKQRLEEWRFDAVALFGDKVWYWKFVCPACGNVQSAADFIKLGKTTEEISESSMVYQDCIGRHTAEHNCDWAAYGFLGTLGKGRLVITPEGKEIEVFDFYIAESDVKLNESSRESIEREETSTKV
ncbi:hypothetical protein CN931_14490 [Bacillus sp. AFS054943]|uniref:Uncharacterized protein n=1 Tax=Bacillus cereus TaxID=1396 RepID=A0A2C1LLR7_BACCE|nr:MULTISPECIES: VVA0879 family protein [Bacillus]PGL82609.1 hypothetical protein CN931_14490 [Bacillus sp. AFS054943]PGT99412.1 hypothetical protein COD19_18995 [Bacillus cereus]TKI45562.1 hypothetical protein FC700_10460 [Bacillus mycoides]